MNKLTNPASLNTDLATLVLRIIFGGMFAFVHGWMKITGYDAMASQFDIIGIGSELTLILVIFAEFVCGLFILFGFLTRFAVIPVFITMLVAFFMAHAADPFLNKMIPFIYLFLCVVIFILGSGRYSLDAAIFRNKRPETNS